MSAATKWITYLILAAIVVLIITHPVGFALDSTAAGKVGDTTLGILSGSGTSGGASGNVNLNSGSFSVAA